MPEVRTEVKTEFKYPEVPAAGTLDCMGEPQVPLVLGTDVELATFLEAVRVAGEDCRVKLGGVRDWLSGWPTDGLQDH